MCLCESSCSTKNRHNSKADDIRGRRRWRGRGKRNFAIILPPVLSVHSHICFADKYLINVCVTGQRMRECVTGQRGCCACGRCAYACACEKRGSSVSWARNLTHFCKCAWKRVRGRSRESPVHMAICWFYPSHSIRLWYDECERNLGQRESWYKVNTSSLLISIHFFM